MPYRVPHVSPSPSRAVNYTHGRARSGRAFILSAFAILLVAIALGYAVTEQLNWISAASTIAADGAEHDDAGSLGNPLAESQPQPD